MKLSSIWYTILVLLLASLLIAGCGAQTQTTSTPPTPLPKATAIKATATNTPSLETPNAPGPAPASTQAPLSTPIGHIREFSIVSKQFTYEPSTITVNKGDKVVLTLTTADVAHGFSLPDFGIDQRIEPGATATVTFVADKAGTFTWRCNIPCGAGHQHMTGKLVVV